MKPSDAAFLLRIIPDHNRSLLTCG